MLSSCLITLIALPVLALTHTTSNSNSGSNDLSSTELRIPIYRYYSSHLIDHYYTSDYTQLRRGDDVYKYEGVGFYLSSQQDEFENYIPIYQYYQPSPAFNHYYSTNPYELTPYKDFLGFCCPEEYKQEDMVPLYKYYQKEGGDCLYTTATEEIGFNLKIGDLGNDDYEYQGVECYVFSYPGERLIEDASDLEEIPIIKALHQHGEISKHTELDISREGDGFYMRINGDGGDDDLNGNYDKLDATEPVGDNGQDMVVPLKDENENKDKDDEEVLMDYKFILKSGNGIRDHWGVYVFVSIMLIVFIFASIMVIFTHIWCYKYSASKRLVGDRNQYQQLL